MSLIIIITEREAVEPPPPRTPARGALPPCARGLQKPKKQKQTKNKPQTQLSGHYGGRGEDP